MLEDNHSGSHSQKIPNDQNFLAMTTLLQVVFKVHITCHIIYGSYIFVKRTILTMPPRGYTMQKGRFFKTFVMAFFGCLDGLPKNAVTSKKQRSVLWITLHFGEDPEMQKTNNSKKRQNYESIEMDKERHYEHTGPAQLSFLSFLRTFLSGVERKVP